MSKSGLKIPAEFRNAAPEERIAFVQMLWDEIAQDPDSIPVTDEHKAILDDRLRAYEEDGHPGESWPVVRDRILADLRTR